MFAKASLTAKLARSSLSMESQRVASECLTYASGDASYGIQKGHGPIDIGTALLPRTVPQV
jgi:hypothetical protein